MIGGNIATKAKGLRSVKYGSVDDYLVSLEFITPEGEVVNTNTKRGPKISQIGKK